MENVTLEIVLHLLFAQCSTNEIGIESQCQAVLLFGSTKATWRHVERIKVIFVSTTRFEHIQNVLQRNNCYGQVVRILDDL